ncbi:MAG: DUF1850 domain-containing protein [Desulfobacterales bacterium]|nr:DUF1850 domain-containing protein [Desulfobacterales bacterium]
MGFLAKGRMGSWVSLLILPVLISACAALHPAPPQGETGSLVVVRFSDVRELGSPEAAPKLGRYPLGTGGDFTLSFIHSVSLTRVVDFYEIRGGRILQTKEVFQAHGAGLPTSPEEPGGTAFVKTEEGFVLHMERPIHPLVVRTDKRYENRLSLGGRTIDLNQWKDQALLIYPD